MYQHYCATQNQTFLEQTALPLIENVAEFWASQVFFNETTQKYDTLNET